MKENTIYSIIKCKVLWALWWLGRTHGRLRGQWQHVRLGFTAEFLFTGILSGRLISLSQSRIGFQSRGSCPNDARSFVVSIEVKRTTKPGK
jgi:hypothetical protein